MKNTAQVFYFWMHKQGIAANQGEGGATSHTFS